MNRTTEDIRDNMDYVGCDNQTALEMCDEIDRLTSERNELREQVKAARAVIALVRASRLEAEKARPA